MHYNVFGHPLMVVNTLHGNLDKTTVAECFAYWPVTLYLSMIKFAYLYFFQPKMDSLHRTYPEYNG